MPEPLLLASGSTIRAQLLRRAGVVIEVVPARIDEPALQAALTAEGANPRDIADALAEQKARKVSLRRAGALVLGCDQVMVHDGAVLGKPGDLAQARARLRALSGQTHQLVSAAVLYRDGQPLWRHVDHATLRMREFSDNFLDTYLAQGWPELAETVGAYKIEELGVRLFSDIQGSHFTILGLPLVPLLVHLGRIGVIEA